MQISAWVAEARATSSGFAIEVAVNACFFERGRLVPPETENTKPRTDFRFTVRPLKSASKCRLRLSFKVKGLSKDIPAEHVPFMYRKTHFIVLQSWLSTVHHELWKATHADPSVCTGADHEVHYASSHCDVSRTIELIPIIIYLQEALLHLIVN